MWDRIANLRPGESLVVGSDPENQAKITRTSDSWYIQDADSRDGTLLNNVAVYGRKLITHGDHIRVGGEEQVSNLLPEPVPSAPPSRIVVPPPVPPVWEAAPPRPQPSETVVPVPPVWTAAPSNSVSFTPKPSHSISGVPSVALNNAVQTVYIKGEPRRILNNVTVSAKKGEFIGVVGGSGSGKSTLLKAIAGLGDIDSGAILLDGQQVSRAQLLSDKRIAYLPQDVVIHESLTPNAALGYIAELKKVGATRGERERIIASVLERTGMTQHANTPVYRLSGGQRKRVAMAAELIGDPQIILLDEATSGLDPSTEKEMMHLFKSLADEGKTVICITHFPKHLFLCDRLLYMMEGNLIFSGTPTECTEFFGVQTIEEI